MVMFGKPGPMTYYEVRVVLFVENGEIRIIDKASPVKKRVAESDGRSFTSDKLPIKPPYKYRIQWPHRPY